MFLEYSTAIHQNGLCFRTKKEAVRQFFNSPVNEFYKTPLSKNLIDHFYELNIQTFYDDDQILIGIEIYQPNRLIYNTKITLLDQSYYSLLSELKQNKIQYEIDSDGLNIEKGKIGIYVYNNLIKNAECVSVYVDLLKAASITKYIEKIDNNKSFL